MAVYKSKLTKKVVKIIGLILLATLVGIQFVPTKPNQSVMVPQTDFMVVNNVPLSVKKKIQVSCYDCHSNNTVYPWYNKIQPVAWYLENHIKHGKEELNFSLWGELSKRRKLSKLKSIISQIKNDEMPITQYTLIHRETIFSEEEKLAIIEYMTKLKQKFE